MHLARDPGTFISTRHSRAVLVKPRFLAATAGNSAFRSAVVEKSIDATSSTTIPLASIMPVIRSWAASKISSREFESLVVAPLTPLTFMIRVQK